MASLVGVGVTALAAAAAFDLLGDDIDSFFFAGDFFAAPSKAWKKGRAKSVCVCLILSSLRLSQSDFLEGAEVGFFEHLEWS